MGMTVAQSISNALMAFFVSRPLNRHRGSLALPPDPRLLTHCRGQFHTLLAADPELMPLPDDLATGVHATGAWTHDEPSTHPEARPRS